LRRLRQSISVQLSINEFFQKREFQGFRLGKNNMFDTAIALDSNV
jgi:hypothetical protein